MFEFQVVYSKIFLLSENLVTLRYFNFQPKMKRKLDRNQNLKTWVLKFLRIYQRSRGKCSYGYNSNRSKRGRKLRKKKQKRYRKNLKSKVKFIDYFYGFCQKFTSYTLSIHARERGGGGYFLCRSFPIIIRSFFIDFSS